MQQKIHFLLTVRRMLSGADPGVFLGGGALVSCSTSTPINYIVFLFLCRISVVLENRRSSQGGGVRTPCTLPLDPPLRNNAATCFLWYCIGGVLPGVSLDIKIYPPDPNGPHLLAFDCMNN